jgi:hypothetical protein
MCHAERVSEIGGFKNLEREHFAALSRKLLISVDSEETRRLRQRMHNDRSQWMARADAEALRTAWSRSPRHCSTPSDRRAQSDHPTGSRAKATLQRLDGICVAGIVEPGIMMCRITPASPPTARLLHGMSETHG